MLGSEQRCHLQESWQRQWPQRFWLGLWNPPSCPGRAHGLAASWAVALKVAGLIGGSDQDWDSGQSRVGALTGDSDISLL